MHRLKTSKNPTGNSVQDLIAEALERGDFEDLPNEGKPLRLDGYFSVKPEHQISSQLLMDNNAVPQPLQDKKEIEGLLRQVAQLLQDGVRELADVREEIEHLGESLLAIFPDRDTAAFEIGAAEWIASTHTGGVEQCGNPSSKIISRTCVGIRRLTKRYNRRAVEILTQHMELTTQADLLIKRLNTRMMEGPVMGGSRNQMRRISVMERQKKAAKDLAIIDPLPDGLEASLLSYFRRTRPNPFHRFWTKMTER